MFGAASYGSAYFGEGPGAPAPFVGPVAEQLDAANGPPSGLHASAQQVPLGGAGQNAVPLSAAGPVVITIAAARE
jgi:hypothetical protein